MNWLDIVIVIFLIIATLMGLKTGLIKSVLSLAGLIIGIILAGKYYVELATHLGFIPNPDWAKIAAFVIILIVVMIVATLIAMILEKIISAIMLGWLNHLGGAIFGFIWGAVRCGALITIWAKFAGGAGATIQDSALAGPLLNYLPLVLALLPAEFNSIKSFLQ